MTKEQLEQYVALKREVEQLQADLDKQFDKIFPVLAGSVKTSSKRFPYVSHEINIPMSNPELTPEVKELIRIQDKRLKDCLRQTIEIERFISSIEDSSLRQIFKLRYIKGLKLREVARIVHLDLSVVSRKITDYCNLQIKQKNQCYNLN